MQMARGGTRQLRRAEMALYCEGWGRRAGYLLGGRGEVVAAIMLTCIMNSEIRSGLYMDTAGIVVAMAAGRGDAGAEDGGDVEAGRRLGFASLEGCHYLMQRVLWSDYRRGLDARACSGG